MSHFTFTKPFSTPASAPPFSSAALVPYTGSFGKQEAGHLLGRATFGPTYAQLTAAAAQGLDATLDQLLADLPLPPPPLVRSAADGAPIGETWVDQPYDAANPMRSVVVRIRSLFAYLGRNLMTEGISARQTMTLFWHNHFSINTAVEPKYNYRYLATLQTHVFGDFRQLVKDITVDPLMLTFLNGNQNRRQSPNENYARELLELFTLGKGPQVGEGDYTHYTEQDVVAMSRSLTGWRDYGFNATDTGDFGSRFFPNRHDPGTVQLSHRFGNRTFASSGESTYADLVDLILERDEVARFLVRKLYRWFVYYEIDEATETAVIEPLAELLRQEDYRIKPVLRALLGSEHFFAVRSQGPMIKHPLAVVVGMARQFEVEQRGNDRQREQLYVAVMSFARDLGMVHFTSPNVAGWKAFYQEPLYYRLWINGATLPLRQRYAVDLLSGRAEVPAYGTLDVDLLRITEQFPDPAGAREMIAEWTGFLLPRPVNEAQIDYLQDILLPGLPPTQWTVEYAGYAANPNDAELAAALETKLRRMVTAIAQLPEFQLL